jgi:hypothetical protein
MAIGCQPIASARCGFCLYGKRGRIRRIFKPVLGNKAGNVEIIGSSPRHSVLPADL